MSKFQIEKITKRVMSQLIGICQQRRAKVDFQYWEIRTREILGTKTETEALIVPARAGAGKSTWILAFLLALSELFQEGDELAHALGGVLLVFQKVETLNETVDAICGTFPQADGALIVALQGWSDAGKERGFCANSAVTCWRECHKNRCPFAASCALLDFIQQAPSAFILGMTQARFSMLRQTGDLDGLFLRETSNGRPAIPRRFLIFDEKFELSQTAVLNTAAINAASSELESLVSTRDVTDSRIHQLQKSLGFHVEQPFRALREELIFRRDGQLIDMPAGVCRFHEIDEGRREGYQRFRTLLMEQRRDLSTRHLRQCLSVMDAMYAGNSCFFTKNGGFSVFYSAGPQLCYGAAQTILFDATAEIDGDYLHLDHMRFLKGSAPLHRGLVHFHIYSHQGMNVSKSAMGKSWKLPAFVGLR